MQNTLYVTSRHMSSVSDVFYYFISHDELSTGWKIVR